MSQNPETQVKYIAFLEQWVETLKEDHLKECLKLKAEIEELKKELAIYKPESDLDLFGDYGKLGK